jgi:hypothetical protein
MIEESILIVIAEISVALAGFSGIAAAFGRRQERTWSEDERSKLANLLNHSGIALFASLIPLISAQAGGFDAGLWMTCSLLWVFFASFGLGFAIRDLRRAKLAGRGEPFPLSLIGFVALWLFQLANALIWQLAWPYFLALTGNLAFAFVQFMALVNPSSKIDVP